ncbi:hypothetical protein C2G38_2186565 [Gigaspora rosea]|uniref:Uncharacterized protein n=1 Tax=Gigaspora rosea TaxID=44941 RepID=A0A397V7V9_9GLOM|nr:hypothetical protein C2G38_2186565 [Gigaspora rosea]
MKKLLKKFIKKKAGSKTNGMTRKWNNKKNQIKPEQEKGQKWKATKIAKEAENGKIIQKPTDKKLTETSPATVPNDNSNDDFNNGSNDNFNKSFSDASKKININK